MVKSLLTECVSVPVLGDVGNPLLWISRLEPYSGEAEVFPRRWSSFP
jgi:hypothetical protein